MLDTRQKRSSAVALLGWATLAPPVPDGELDQGDRQLAVHEYASFGVVLPFEVDWIRTAIARERPLRRGRGAAADCGAGRGPHARAGRGADAGRTLR